MKKKANRAMIITLSIIGAIIIIMGMYLILISPVSRKDNSKQVVIPLGTSATKIAEILKENDLIRSKLIFKAYVKIYDISNFQAGTYYLKENMSLEEIVGMLQTGKMNDPNQINITYIEGKNIKQLAAKIEEVTNNKKEDVYELLKNEEYINSLIEKYWFLTEDIKNKDIYYPLEGYLFPDTYTLKNKNVTVQEIFKKMLDQTEIVLDKYKDEIEESKYSVHQILTIASIIETESMTAEARKNVSSVIYNRLESNMPIQSDVTTYYAFGIDIGSRDLYQKEINKYNQYNTRGPKMDGKLPIGPISSCGRASIEAALEPNNTDYLFFVADKNGKVYFSKTQQEHSQIIKDLKDQGLWLEY